MTVSLLHKFASAKSNGTDNTLIQPSNWNDQHALTLNGNSVLGNSTGSNAAATEIPMGPMGMSILAANVLADLIAAGVPIATTGDMKPTIKTAADTGWVMCSDGTIGNGTSGATELADSTKALALFELIWTNITNTNAPIQDSTGAATTRGATASADFAASKRIPVPIMLGRVLGAAGSGAGLTARTLGQNVGEETHLLTTPEMPSHTHTDSGHTHPPARGAHFLEDNTGQQALNSGTVGQGGTATGTGFANLQNTGGGVAHNNMQPTTFVNWMIKL